MYNLIVAVCKNNGIGLNGTIPWHISRDMSYFSKLTKGSGGGSAGGGNNVVVMGSQTWKSLGKDDRGLNGRHNFILSASGSVNVNKTSSAQNPHPHQHQHPQHIKTFPSVAALTTYLAQTSIPIADVWIIGGTQIYNAFLEQNLIKTCYVTYIDKVFECDTFFPIPSDWREIERTSTYDEKYECAVDYIVYDLGKRL